MKDTPPALKFPLVIIKEVQTKLNDETLKKGEQRFLVQYEIEIYTINQENAVKQEITKELKYILFNIFFCHYGMDIKANQQLPNGDNDVHRWQLKFQAIIDENNKIYRR